MDEKLRSQSDVNTTALAHGDENRWVLGLERVRKALERLGQPQNSYTQVLVGGTNGKGSTSIYLERILSVQGYRVGTTISPRLSRFTERFRIDGREVEAAEMQSLIQEIEPLLSDVGLTYFEWTVVLAAVIFARQRLDYGIFEIGLGGRLDAANVLDPQVSIITNIALDHMDYLGETVEAIAKEKAAIARPERDLITSADDGLPVIRAYAAHIGARLTTVTEPLPLRTGITGPRQGLNAALALAASLALGHSPAEAELRYALNTAFLPGRVERLGRVTLDVAHNPAAMGLLVEHLEQLDFTGIVVLGVLGDKDYLTMARMLKDICREIFIAPVNAERSWTSDDMDKIAALGGVTRYPSIRAALDQALLSGQNVVVTGSFYTVGEVRDTIIWQSC